MIIYDQMTVTMMILWSEICDNEDDDASEVEDSYGVGDDDKRAKGEEKGM